MYEKTPYQEKLIKRYYKNRDDIMKQKLSELITDLYLAEGKKRDQIWKRIAAALTNLGIDSFRIERIVATDNPALLAEFLEKKRKK
jgi:acetylornithine deacetylase/succinyl-diaminopimelate desuccinylase-like protein